jgi:Tfp pilus assembly protein PilF
MQFHPDAPDSHRLRAELALSQGEIATAISGFKQAIAMGARDAVLRLYQTYLFSGDVAVGVRFLEARLAEEQRGDHALLNKALAEGYLRLGDLNAAGKIYTLLLDAGSQDAEVLNNLAMIRFQQGEVTAQALARSAHALAPDNPAINDTLGWILVKGGEPAEGLGYLRNASLMASGNKSIRFHIAAALVSLGRRDEAREALQDLMASAGEFAERAEAGALLKQLETGN